MCKIPLVEAREHLDNMRVVDVFASLVSSSLLEDKEKLQNYINLTNKIHHAEKHFGIDDYKHRVNLLKEKEQYHSPYNAVFYYKHIISQEMKDSNKVIWDELKEEIKDIEDKIEYLSEHIYIKVE